MKIGVIGVPTSAAAFAPGQEQAPQALRDAGLLEALRRAGVEVHDRGDRATWRWRPDRGHPRAQNVNAIVEIVQQTSRRVQEAVADGELTLVLGGDCTVGIGTVSGHVAAGERIGLLYFDTHADLNVPTAVSEGALDWMGMAHMLALPGAAGELVSAGARVPLLEAEQVVLFAWGPAGCHTEDVRREPGRRSCERVRTHIGPVTAYIRARVRARDEHEATGRGPQRFHHPWKIRPARERGPVHIGERGGLRARSIMRTRP